MRRHPFIKLTRVSELAYLAVAILMSAMGSMFVWLRQRKPQSLQSGVTDFSKGLAALAVRPDKTRPKF